ncbi:MAG: hypothetical protein ICV66_00695 [Chitinophagaceae bacterium]|nr:hypothetical protein [Chitinophagaceae bacterium]
MLDMRSEFGVPANSEYVQFDGGHLTMKGQKLVAEALVKKLTVPVVQTTNASVGGRRIETP